MDVLRASLKTKLGLDTESVTELAQYVVFQGTPEGMEAALVEILGDRDAAKQMIAEYFGNTGLQKMKNKAEEDKRKDEEIASKVVKPKEKLSIGLSDSQMNDMKFFSGAGLWNRDSRNMKKMTNTKKVPVSSSKSGNSSPSKATVKIDSLADIEAALNQIDLSITKGKRVRCTCMGTRHPLLEAAPNCLNCGKIICIKEGLGPCLFCGEPLISSEHLEEITSILEGEKSEIASTMGRKAREKAGIQGINMSGFDKSRVEAEKRLERLLDYQASSAERTKIIDRAADFETPDVGLNKWASPLEQAKQLKKQQRQLRKQEEKRLARQGRGKKIISIDLEGHKAIIKEELAAEESSDEDEDQEPGGPVKPSGFFNLKAYEKDFIQPVYIGRTKTKKKVSDLPIDVGKFTENSKIEFDDNDDDLASSWAHTF